MSNHVLLEKLQEAFKSGNHDELTRLSGQLTAQKAGDGCLLPAMAAMACADVELDRRMPVITALAELDEKQQPFRVQHCRDRDMIAARLAEENRWPQLLSLLRSSLLRWQPDTENRADLAWLTGCLINTKEQCRGRKARLNLNLPGGGTVLTASHSYMNLLLAETLAAAAGAWHRCLRGPGGVNFCLDNLWVFTDPDLAEELMYLLTQDPVAYAALVNEIKESYQDTKNSGRAITGAQHDPGVDIILRPESLRQGIRTSEQCLAILKGQADKVEL